MEELDFAWSRERTMPEVSDSLSSRTATDLTVFVTMTEVGTVRRTTVRICVQNGKEAPERNLVGPNPGEQRESRQGAQGHRVI